MMIGISFVSRQIMSRRMGARPGFDSVPAGSVPQPGDGAAGGVRAAPAPAGGAAQAPPASPRGGGGKKKK